MEAPVVVAVCHAAHLVWHPGLERGQANGAPADASRMRNSVRRTRAQGGKGCIVIYRIRSGIRMRNCRRRHQVCGRPEEGRRLLPLLLLLVRLAAVVRTGPSGRHGGGPRLAPLVAAGTGLWAGVAGVAGGGHGAGGGGQAAEVFGVAVPCGERELVADVNLRQEGLCRRPIPNIWTEQAKCWCDSGVRILGGEGLSILDHTHAAERRQILTTRPRNAICHSPFKPLVVAGACRMMPTKALLLRARG